MSSFSNPSSDRLGHRLDTPDPDSDMSFDQNEHLKSIGNSPAVMQNDYNSQFFPDVPSGLGPISLMANGPRNEMDNPTDSQSGATGWENGNGLTHSNITPNGFDLLSTAANELGTGRANSKFLFPPNHAEYVQWSDFQQQGEHGPWARNNFEEVGTLESPSTVESNRSGPVRRPRRHSQAITLELVSGRNSSPPPAALAITNALETAARERVTRVRAQNRLAARRSRAKKVAEFQRLKTESERLLAENERWRNMAMEIIREGEKENKETIKESKEKWEKMARDILERWNLFDERLNAQGLNGASREQRWYDFKELERRKRRTTLNDRTMPDPMTYVQRKNRNFIYACEQREKGEMSSEHK